MLHRIDKDILYKSLENNYSSLMTSRTTEKNTRSIVDPSRSFYVQMRVIFNALGF